MSSGKILTYTIILIASALISYDFIKTAKINNFIPSNSAIDLSADITIDEATLKIINTNKDLWFWNNVIIKINGINSSGYTTKIDRVTYLNIYSLPLFDFTKSDGERFNPFTHKVLEVEIFCDLINYKNIIDNNKKGYYQTKMIN
nr:hypothetical protein [uncultured Desulfobulbus sp.]